MLGVALHLWDAPSDTAFYPPISEEILMFFVAHCSEHLHLKAATIKVYLAGIRNHYVQAGYDNPHLSPSGHTWTRLAYTMRI